jgi:hypothetical protein
MDNDCIGEFDKRYLAIFLFNHYLYINRGFKVSKYKQDNGLVDLYQKSDDPRLIEDYDEGIDVCIMSYDSVNRLIDQTHLLIDIVKSQKAEMELLRLKIDILEKKLAHQRSHIYVPGPSGKP